MKCRRNVLIARSAILRTTHKQGFAYKRPANAVRIRLRPAGSVISSNISRQPQARCKPSRSLHVEAAQVRPLDQLRTRGEARIGESAIDFPAIVIPHTGQGCARRHHRLLVLGLSLILKAWQQSNRRQNEHNLPHVLQQTQPPKTWLWWGTGPANQNSPRYLSGMIPRYMAKGPSVPPDMNPSGLRRTYS